MKRQARLFAITELLRARRTGVTAEALAERFGVTVRTIYRDLDAVRDAGLPLLAERGRGGGYALDRAYSLPPVNFTPKEAALLCAIGHWAREMRFLPFVDTVASALDKVRGALSASAQRELVGQVDRLRFIGIPALSVAAEVRAAVETAWLEQRPLAVVYRNKEGERRERTVTVVGLLMERTTTWLECVDRDRDEPRTLRLDRIETARLVFEEQAPTPTQVSPAALRR